MPFMATALASLMSLPAVALTRHPSPVDRLERLERALGPDAPTILIKRDDLLTFGRQSWPSVERLLASEP